MPVTFAGPNIFALGAAVGLLCHAFSNVVRKINITHRPWELPIAAAIGGYSFHWWDGVCERAQEKLTAVQAERFETNKAVVPPPQPSAVPKF